MQSNLRDLAAGKGCEDVLDQRVFSSCLAATFAFLLLDKFLLFQHRPEQRNLRFLKAVDPHLTA
jgi:hypothetical protein